MSSNWDQTRIKDARILCINENHGFSTILGKLPEPQYPGQQNHRICMTTAVDFVEFNPTEILLNPGFNCIDATIQSFDGKVVIFFKDEGKAPQSMKNLHVAMSQHWRFRSLWPRHFSMSETSGICCGFARMVSKIIHKTTQSF